MADGYIGLFRVPDTGVPKIVLDGDPTIAVEEDNISYKSEEGGISNANVTVSDIDVTEGEITSIVTAYKVTGANDDTYSKKVHSVIIPEGTTSGVAHLVIEGLKVLPEKDTTITYDFKVWFLNADQQYASNGTNDIGEDSNYLSATAVPFDGIDDLDYLYEVMDLTCLNDGIGNGEGGGANAITLNRDLVKLGWSAATNVYPEYRLNAGSREASGISASSSFEKWVKSYVVYMFEATTETEPEHPWPTSTETNGTWSKLIEVTDKTVEVAVPHNKYIAFWVGVKVKGNPSDPIA